MFGETVKTSFKEEKMEMLPLAEPGNLEMELVHGYW